MGCRYCHTATRSLRPQNVCWIYCPGHASENALADRLSSTADTSGLQLGRAEVLRGYRNFLNMDSPEHHSLDLLKERRVEEKIGRRSILRGREQSVLKKKKKKKKKTKKKAKQNKKNFGGVSRATLGRPLRDGAERVRAFPSAAMHS